MQARRPSGFKGITPSFTLQNRFLTFPDHLDLQLGDGLALVDTENLCLSGNRISDKDRSGEFPVLAQKNGPRTWHIHGNQRMEKSGG